MRRRAARPLSLLLAVGALVVVAGLAGPMPAAHAAASEPTDRLVLAVEGEGEGEEAPGLEPKEADNSENEFAPENYEANFLWGAAVGLLVITLAIVGGIGAAWYLLVVRPNQTPTRS